MDFNEDQLKAMYTSARDQCWARLRNSMRDIVRLSEGGFRGGTHDLELVEMIASLMVAELYYHDAQHMEEFGDSFST